MILNVVYFCEKCEESAGIVVREMDGRKLFYKLLLEQTKCKKVSEIADEMNISKKSIYNYLGDLEKDLPKYGLKIKKVRGWNTDYGTGGRTERTFEETLGRVRIFNRRAAGNYL